MDRIKPKSKSVSHTTELKLSREEWLLLSRFYWCLFSPNILHRVYHELLYILSHGQISCVCSKLADVFIHISFCCCGRHTYRGPIGDRFGRKICYLVLHSRRCPFTLLLPHANLSGRACCLFYRCYTCFCFSAILVYAQELLPGKIGMISGLFFGFAFGMGGSVLHCWAHWQIIQALNMFTMFAHFCR